MRPATRATRAAALAAAACALAAGLLTGCGSGSGDDAASGSGGAGAETGAGAGAGATPGTDGEQEGAGEQGGAAGQPDVPLGETVPRGELTPATGSFTERETDYLVGRVPEGSDPAAILQLGADACDRIGYLARHDRPAAVAALREGEIPEAEAAVRHLCPEHQDLLDAAGAGG